MTGLLVALAGGTVYAAGVLRLRSKGRPWPGTRTSAFFVGLGVLAIASVAGGPKPGFTSHMAEHVAIGLIAPLALALGAPVTLALQASGRRRQRLILRLLQTQVVRAATYPLVAWATFALTPFAIYFTPVFEWSLRNDAVHEAVHLHFLAVGMLFFWPAVGLDPIHHRLAPGARVLYLFVAVPFHALLGLALLSANQVLGHGTWTLDEQRSGAGLMWAAGEVIGLTATLVATIQWMQADARAANRVDRGDGNSGAAVQPTVVQPSESE